MKKTKKHAIINWLKKLSILRTIDFLNSFENKVKSDLKTVNFDMTAISTRTLCCEEMTLSRHRNSLFMCMKTLWNQCRHYYFKD